jgi:hypothetical protein
VERFAVPWYRATRTCKKRLPRVGSVLTCLVGVERFELSTSRTRTTFKKFGF